MSGLDPLNAKIMKDMILAQKKRGKTILLTTHNMHDAEELCDRVAFLFDGAIVALDSPRALIMSRGAATIHYGVLQDDKEQWMSTPLSATAQDPVLFQALATNTLTHIHSSEPNLNDIFLELTGRALQ
jgi:fluoroquinolone transport system ATP-binding protein